MYDCRLMNKLAGSIETSAGNIVDKLKKKE